MGRTSSRVGRSWNARRGFFDLRSLWLILVLCLSSPCLPGASEEPLDSINTVIDRIEVLMDVDLAGAQALAIEAMARPDAGEPAVEAALRIELAALARIQGDLDTSVQEASRARDLANGLGDKVLLASSLNELLGARLGQGRIDDAFELAEASLQLRREIGDQAEIAKTLNNLGLIHSQTGRYVDALSYYLESLRLKELIGDEYSAAATLNNIAVVRFEMGDLKASEDCLIRARTIFEAVGDKAGQADVLDNLGRCKREEGLLDEALEFHLASFELEKQLGRREGIAISLNHVGLVFIGLKRYEEALRSSEEALAINRSLGIPRGLAFSLLHLGIAQLKLGQLDRATVTLREGITHAEEAGDLSLLRDLHVNRAEAQAQRGLSALAYESLLEARNLDQQIISRESAIRMAEIEASHRTEKLDREIQMLQLERELHELTIDRNEQQIALLGQENKVNRLTRNSLIGAFAAVVVCLVILQSRYRLKRQSENALQEKNLEIVRQKETVEAQGRKIGESNRELYVTNMKLRELSRAVEQSPTGVLITDRSGSITYVNPRFTEATGYTLEDVRGSNPRIFKSGHHGRDFYRRLWSTISTGQVWRGRFVNRHKDGSLYEEEATISPVINEVGEIFNFVAVMEYHPVRSGVLNSSGEPGAADNGHVDSRRILTILESEILPSIRDGNARDADRSRHSVDALAEVMSLLRPSGDSAGLNGPAEEQPEATDQCALRVLAQADYRINRKVLTGLLGRLGCELTMVSDFDQALAALVERPCDVLILDPGPLEVSIADRVRRIRESARREGADSLRIVCIADLGTDEALQWAAAGVDTVLPHPVTLVSLREQVLAPSGHSTQGKPSG